MENLINSPFFVTFFLILLYNVAKVEYKGIEYMLNTKGDLLWKKY